MIKKQKGQVILEFTFAMIMALIMLFGVMMIFRWVGYDFGWRRIHHDQKLINAVTEDFMGTCLAYAGPGRPPSCSQWKVTEGPIEQIDPYFHKPEKMNSAWGL